MRGLYLFSSLAAVCLALPTDKHVVHETRHERHGAAAMVASAQIPLRIALSQKNLDIAEQKLLHV